MKKISIGVCCFNEEDNIELMYKAISSEMEKMQKYDYEIIFADNNSVDKSQNILRELALCDKHVKVIFNQTNFGAEKSGVNCYRNSTGDAYIGIACDFQDPPELIPRFLEEWEKGFDIVWGKKTKSEENSIKYACRKIYYSIIRLMSDYPIYDQVTGFGLMDRKVLDIIYVTQEQDPEYTMRNLVCEYGFNIKLLPYVQKARERGKSSYNISRYFHFAITSLVNTSIKPLRLLTVCGMALSFLCVMVALFYLFYKIFHWNSFEVGIAPLLIGVFFLSGVQLFSIGLLGEYISVLLRRVTKKPIVIEKEKINFDEDIE